MIRRVLSRAAADPRYVRILHWGRLISITGMAQMLIQGLGLLSGILIIHLVSPAEYALYTLTYTMLGAIVALADAGVSNGVLSQGAKKWEDREALGRVVRTGMELRWQLAAAVFAVSLPILFILLVRHGATWITATVIILALVPAFYATLTDDLLAVPVKIHQDIAALQRNDVLANIGRFLSLVVGLFFVPFTAVAILANGLPRIWANIQLRKRAVRFANLSAEPDPEVRQTIIALVKRTMPGTIYYCVSGQLQVWLISVFGNTASIAEVGALTRLAAFLTVLSTMFGILVMPRFARLPEEPRLLLSIFLKIYAGMLVFSAAIPLLVGVFPSEVLFILGKQYANLTDVVSLAALSGCTFTMVSLLYGLAVARGWILSPSINIGTSVLVQILLILTLDLSTTRGVLIFALSNAVWGLVMYTAYFLYKVYELHRRRKLSE